MIGASLPATSGEVEEIRDTHVTRDQESRPVWEA